MRLRRTPLAAIAAAVLSAALENGNL